MHHLWRWGITSAMTAILSLSSLPVWGQTSTPQEQQASPDQVTFFCKDVHDPASGKKIPATLVWVPQRQGNIRIIGWKSEFFSRFGWNPQKRCAEVTPKFQQFYDAGQLKYLTTGYSNGYPIVCALAQENDACESSRQLFTMKPHDNPNQLLHQLMDILKGKTADMLLQNSGGETLVPVPEFFRRAPITDRTPPRRRKSAGSQVKPTEAERQAPSPGSSTETQKQDNPFVASVLETSNP